MSLAPLLSSPRHVQKENVPPFEHEPFYVQDRQPLPLLSVAFEKYHAAALSLEHSY